MPDTGAEAAQRYREARRAKAARLGEGEDAVNVDASDFTPGEPLDADAKTGMRPVSRQARKSGGVVSGAHASATPGRAARKSGGGVGIDYVNRNAKAANEDRAGRKHDLGLKKGGRAKRAVGGIGGAPAITLGGAPPRAPRKMGFVGGSGKPIGLHRHSSDTLHSMAESETDPTRLGHIFDEIDRRSGRARGGRLARATGGRADEDVYVPRKERAGAAHTRELTERSASAAEVDEPKRVVRASGGRVARQGGGPLATPLAAGMGGQGRFNFNYGPQQSEATKLGLKDGGRAKAHERYGHGPSCSCPSCRKGKAGGGLSGLGMLGGALPLAISELSGGSDDDKPAPYSPGSKRHGGRAGRQSGGAIGQPSEKHPAPKGGSRAHTMKEAEERAAGGSVEKKVLAAHHAEHEAMKEGKANGGRTAHAKGGKAGKGKMSVNIVIAPGGANPQPAGPPGMPPNLSIRPPAAPMPMPPPGGAPAPGAPSPMPMPVPIPMGGGQMPPGGMPPRARGGRAPHAGSGSGLGRLQKTSKYGRRSHETADPRP